MSRHFYRETDILVCSYTGHPFEGGRFFCGLFVASIVTGYYKTSVSRNRAASLISQTEF